MAVEKLNLRILTPTRTVLETQADFVVLRCSDGDKGVLPNHESFIAKLDMGLLQAYVDKQVTDRLFVMGGSVIMDKGDLTVLSPVAGNQEEVERDLHRIEEQLAERRHEELMSQVDIRRAEVALRNAFVDVDVSSYSVLSASRDKNVQ